MASESKYLSSVGTGTWNNANNALGAHSGSCADTASDAAQQIWIAGGFSIPSGVTIDGVEVVIHCAGDGDDDVTIEVADTGSLDWGTPKNINDQGGSNCAGAADVTRGGSSDLWDGSWAWNNINGNGVYVRLTYAKSGKANSWYVDYVLVTVYYTSVTEYTIQKTADFRTKVEQTAQKNADFRVLGESTIQKTADFTVVLETTIQKGSDFRVLGEETVQKNADFRVKVVDNTIQKNSDFRVLQEGTIQKNSDFRVKGEETVQKSADFRVKGESTIQKTANFRVEIPGAGGQGTMIDWAPVIGSHP